MKKSSGSGNWALITGAASGIGLACATHLARQGIKLVLLDLDEPQLLKTSGHLREQTGTDVLSFSLDVSDAQRLEDLALLLDQQGVVIDYLITAAGVLQPMKPLNSLDPRDHERVWRVNYHGTAHCIRVWGERMFERQCGSIVTISSVTAFRATPLLAYGPAKAALNALTASLAVRYAQHRVRINAVCPGFTATQALLDKIQSGQRNLDSIVANIPMRRLIDPAEIANTVAFLLSDQASAITGVSLPVDAGWLAGAHWSTYESPVAL